MKASDVREGTQPKPEFANTPSTRRIPVLATTSRIYRLLLPRTNSQAPRPRGTVKETSIWRNLSHSVHARINRFGGALADLKRFLADAPPSRRIHSALLA